MNEMNDIFFAIDELERCTNILENRNITNTQHIKACRIVVENARKAFKNIMPKINQPKMVYSSEPLTSCGCGHPGAMPPCSFCCP